MQQKQQSMSWTERAAKIFCILTGIGGALLLLYITVRWLLPFVLAALLCAVIRPGAAYFEHKWKIPQKFGSIFLLFLLLILLSGVLIFACNSLIRECGRLLATLTENTDVIGNMVTSVKDVMDDITSHLPLFSRLHEKDALSSLLAEIDKQAAILLTDTLRNISAKIPDVIGKLAGGIPAAFFFLLTFLIAAFYLCADGENITAALLRFLPENVCSQIHDGKKRIGTIAIKFLRAYGLLFLLTFLQLFIGFTILRLPYIFLPAFIIAFVDFLPVLGVGTVLVPWGLFELFRGNSALGTGLLILYGVILLLRQLEEPHILGGSLGLPPLLTLVAVYVGLKVGGLFGMLIAPALAVLIKEWFTRRTEVTAISP